MSNSETKKSGFFYQLKEYGLKRIITSWDFVLSFIFFVVLLQDYLSNAYSFKTLGNESVLAIVTITSTIFAIIIASIAIILSFSSTKFVAFLREHGKLHGILFNFWFCCVTYLAVLLLAFAKYIVNFHAGHFLVSMYNATVLAGFVYAILQTFFVVASIMKFAYFLDFYERSTNLDK